MSSIPKNITSVNDWKNVKLLLCLKITIFTNYSQSLSDPRDYVGEELLCPNLFNPIWALRVNFMVRLWQAVVQIGIQILFEKWMARLWMVVEVVGPDLAVNFTQEESDSDVVRRGEVISATVTLQYLTFWHLSNIGRGKNNTFQLISSVIWRGIVSIQNS